jgi:hypothetical protein
MSMGDLDSPFNLQTFMERVFNTLWPYLDDVHFGDSCFETHLKRLREFLEKCRKYNLKLSPKKCEFAKDELIVLGRKTNAKFVSVDDETAMRIRSIARPRTGKEMQQVLGLANWARNYVPNLGSLTQPLYQVTGEWKIVWTEDLARQFKEFKEALAAPVNIYHMDDSLPIYVIADASKVGWSCCGYQIRGDSYNPEDKSLPDPKPRELKDEEVQLSFLSTGGFANASFNWQINRKECYSFYAGITKNRDKIGGRPFILFTDHKNFTYLTENSSEMVQRWLIALQQFRFWAVHIPGKDNPDADALSRIITVLDDRNVSLDCTIIEAV